MSGFSIPYHSITDKRKSNAYELTVSSEERKNFTHVDCTIDPYQFDKLKLISCSILCVGEVRDAESVTSIYELLKICYAGDFKKAAAVLNILLEVAGVDVLESSSKSPIETDVSSNEVFQRRVRLIQFSDRAVKEKRVSKLFDHLYETFKIRKNREFFTSPVILFQNMFDEGIFKHDDQDLKKIEKFFNFCKDRLYKVA